MDFYIRYYNLYDKEIDLSKKCNFEKKFVYYF